MRYFWAWATVQQFLRQHVIDDRVIRRYFRMAWPFQSSIWCYTNFFLWVYLKYVMYHGGIVNLKDIKDCISQHMQNITPGVLILQWIVSSSTKTIRKLAWSALFCETVTTFAVNFKINNHSILWLNIFFLVLHLTLHILKSRPSMIIATIFSIVLFYFPLLK